MLTIGPGIQTDNRLERGQQSQEDQLEAAQKNNKLLELRLEEGKEAQDQRERWAFRAVG